MPRITRSASTGGIRINPHVTFRSRSSQDNVSSAVLVQKGNLTPQSSAEVSMSESSPLLSDSVTISLGNGALKKSEKVLEEDLDDDVFTSSTTCTKKVVFHHIKVAVILLLTLVCSFYIVLNIEVEEEWRQFSVEPLQHTGLKLEHASATYPVVRMSLQGPFVEEEDVEIGMEGTEPMQIRLANQTWTLHVNTTKLLEEVPVTMEHTFTCTSFESPCSVDVNSSSESTISFFYSYHPLATDHENSVVYALIVLLLVYVLIILELVHRTLAALLGSLAAVAVLAALNERPTMETIVSWIDMETLSLLFGMMILVAIFSDTGFFDYSALKAYELAKGKIWPLITLLCIFSGVVSAFLDNVTTILLLAPVTIRLCEVLNLDPKQILMAEVLFSNIGGTATAIGDPPNVIIVGATASQGITFSVFTVHAALGIVFVSVGGYGLLRVYYRNIENLKNQEPPEVIELRREIELWRKTAFRVGMLTREESIVKALIQQKTAELETTLNRTLHKRRIDEEQDFLSTFHDLKKKYRITNFPLLIKSGCVLFAVMLLLFLHSFISTMHVGLGWIAIFGALWLLVLADISDMESILHKVEWSTLLFFAALFTLMEALAELGLITTIGTAISDVIKSVGEESRLLAALVIIIWVSALASSFIDNIPYTTAMVPVLQQLSEDRELNLQLLPLMLALAFGACLGGNGTLIGASANVVCAGIAEQHGYGISFREFFKVGFPMMLVTVAVATVYMIVCHVLIGWNT
ncbi:P protein-like isoform X1 [Haliotis rufescens]|uniref:P protein-like isoform X1 n=2 Tax=Haliotis rufescens TaxID=6454 RepID=UPI00201F7449|nr:P protein-like isoform X1 [Haliotis rufescens]XP_048240648.1 P protein-like isoform X1 [Haliotis rufescens]XP_048240649.1 P protein-like isoform X1 [Haliotis rufescens]XP_048240650.1 P protein-like isoform X1 [Haliotis rufescens]